MQSFLRFGSMAEISRINSRMRSIAKSNTEILKVRAAFVSVLFMFYTNLNLFAFAILFMLLVLCSKSFELTNTLMRSYLIPCRLMSSTKTATLITLALLTCFRQ